MSVFEVRGYAHPPENEPVVELRRIEDDPTRVDYPQQRWSRWETVELEPSLAHAYHSPDGFAWGYSGSGPAQLALAILLAATGDAEFAVGHYQAFKFETLSKLPWPEPWQLRVDLDRWAVASPRIVSGGAIDTPGIELVG